MHDSHRREFLRAVAGVGVGAAALSLAGCVAPDVIDGGGGGGLGVDGMPTARTVEPEDADVQVASVGDLVSEAHSGSGRVIWIPSEAEIDLTGQEIITSNIIASGRGGGDGEDGALIFSETRGVDSVAYQGGEGFGTFQLEGVGRLTGLRLRGPTFDFWDSLNGLYPGYLPFPDGGESERYAFYDDHHARCVTMHSNESRVDNCEIFGWPTQGIVVGGTGVVASPVIDHCAIHNCMMTSAGYGVDVKRGMPRILHCWFDATRHSINGFGYPDCSYWVEGCTFGPHTSSHWIDMHGLHSNIDGSSSPSSDRYRYRAGGTMVVQNCVFQGTHVIPDSTFGNAGNMTSVSHIRGVPLDGFYFEGNAVAHPSPLDAHRQSSVPDSYGADGDGFYNFYEGSNEYAVQSIEMGAIGTAEQGSG